MPDPSCGITSRMSWQPGAFAQPDLDLAARGRGKPLLAEEPEVFAELQRRLDELLAHATDVRILNAGCGDGARYVPIAERRFVVGIDVEQPPSAGRDEVEERLVGDIETYDFASRRFDVVYCWDVLEHLRDPRRALANLISTLEPGGVVVLGFPHAMSVKGLITRFTPHRFHGWLWRHVLHPGPGYDPELKPFPTVLSRTMAPRAVASLAREYGLSLELCAEYEGWPQKKVRTILKVRGPLFLAVKSLVRVLSFGRVTAAATDVVVLLRKP
jgi:SAM-dependent methyltransferase